MHKPWPGGCRSVCLRLVSGGTDNHLVLVDVRSLGMDRETG